MEYEQAIQAISQIGFPIFVAVWMLFKNSKDQEAQREALSDLKLAIQSLTDQLRGRE